MLRKVEVSFHEKIDKSVGRCYNILCIEITIWFYCVGHGNLNIKRKVLPTFLSIVNSQSKYNSKIQCCI